MQVFFDDGFACAQRLLPPKPRRGLMLIDPSYETARDYAEMPRFVARVARVWNVGVVVLWYPILQPARHEPMLTALRAVLPEAVVLEARFPPARPGHRLVGSGLFVVNPPWGFAEEGLRIAKLIGQAARANGKGG